MILQLIRTGKLSFQLTIMTYDDSKIQENKFRITVTNFAKNKC